jgi:hypothetical protein
VFIDNENCFTTGASSLITPGFVPSQAIPTAIATTALNNVIDSGPLGGQNTQVPVAAVANQGRDFGMGYPTWLYFLNLTAPTSGGSATIDIQLVSSAAATLTSPNVMLDITGGAVLYSNSKFAANTAFRVPLPRAGSYQATTNPNGWLRYIGINVIIATAVLTGGTIVAFLTRDIQDNQVYQAGFSIS